MRESFSYEKIKVLLIEDNRLLRDGTTAMLNEQEDIWVVSSAGNRSALEKAKELAPDVVLLDLGLKSRSSLKVLESIKKQYPKTEVIVMDLIPAHSDVVAFVKAGVSGFISKKRDARRFSAHDPIGCQGSQGSASDNGVFAFSQIVESAIEGEQ